MHDSAAAGMFLGVFGFVMLLFFVLAYIPLVLYLINLQRCFDAIRKEFQPGVPTGLIWLALIPIVNIFVLLTAIILLSISLKKEDEARGAQSFGDGGLAIGLAAVILGFLSWIPLLGMLLAIGSLVCWIMHWMKVSVFRRVLTGLDASAPARAAPYGQSPATPVVPMPVVAPAPPVAVAPSVPTPPTTSTAPDEEATMMYASVDNAKLVCIVGPLQGMSFPVGKGVNIGRSQQVEVSVPDPQISNRHAWVGIINHQLVLRDLNSTNGSYLNDEMNAPVQEMVLKVGDVITLGKHGEVKFRLTLT